MPSALSPAQPAYILRGHHSAQIHALCFLRDNTRLLTGDATGWVVLWNLISKRAAAVWQPHQSSILGIEVWGEHAIITHGRDGFIHVWQIRAEDEGSLSQDLPVDNTKDRRTDPWLLHSLQINTVNFCSFSTALDDGSFDLTTVNRSEVEEARSSRQPILIAATGRKDEEIEVYGLPSEHKLATIPPPKAKMVGMVMAVKILQLNQNWLCVAGYESGLTGIRRYSRDEKAWTTIYLSRPHTQPILSLDVCHQTSMYYTSGADAVIAAHALPVIEVGNEPVEIVPTDHEVEPEQKVQTKHSGQQALTIRSDNKIFATAGWDSRMRIYSIKTLQEVAVLKWHQEGCYAVAFAQVNSPITPSTESDASARSTNNEQSKALVAPNAQGPERTVMTVSQKREEKIKHTHWLAAGSKDGKASLWDIY